MVKSFLLFIFAFFAFTDDCLACQCLGTQRACQDLARDVVFVGRVIETVDVTHLEENALRPGYSMRFVVEEAIAGKMGTEVTVETGNGSGDCGTPLSSGERYLIFAGHDESGKLWTSSCSGNRELTNDPEADKIIGEYRDLVRKDKNSIFGSVDFSEPIWVKDYVSGSEKPVAGLVLHANSEGYSTSTKTKSDGSFEFNDLPKGSYTVVPEKIRGLDFNHDYEDSNKAVLSNKGECARIDFSLQPSTRIRGHVSFPPSVRIDSIMLVAIPTRHKKFEHPRWESAYAFESGEFNFWPLPPGDYYVGVNISTSPSAEGPFPPTYYPGVSKKSDATIVHVEKGEVKDIELTLGKTINKRVVNIVAMGSDGHPLQELWYKIDDPRHPQDTSSHDSVNLDANGKGTITLL